MYMDQCSREWRRRCLTMCIFIGMTTTQQIATIAKINLDYYIMQFNWNYIIIVVAILAGVYFWSKSSCLMTVAGADNTTAKQYRNYSYLMFIIAAALAVYNYFVSKKSFSFSGNMQT